MSKKAQPDAVYQAIFNMLDESILPSLSMVSANCCLAEEIWKLVRHLPYEHRYLMLFFRGFVSIYTPFYWDVFVDIDSMVNGST